MPDRSPHDEFAPLERLFEAQSIAVIGASFNLDKIGGKPIRFLQSAGYQGAIFPVNSRYEVIGNLPCYPNIAAIDSPIDIAIIAVPGHAVDAAIDDCVAAEVPFALIFSAGFGELGEEGRRRQADLVAKARAGGLRLVGPNSLGIASSSNSLIASFASLFDRHKQLKPGRIGFISQSGAVGAFIYGIAEDDGFGFSRFVSVGNEADLDVSDFMAYMAKDSSTSAIGGYLEGVNDGRRFLAAADLVRRAGKPMSFMKVGQSEAGQRAAASHTGSIAGTDAIYDAAFRKGYSTSCNSTARPRFARPGPGLRYSRSRAAAVSGAQTVSPHLVSTSQSSLRRPPVGSQMYSHHLPRHRIPSMPLARSRTTRRCSRTACRPCSTIRASGLS